ncbi:MAG: ATP-binding cassette domain-containing protein [Pseudomonadota bacterium]|nr:ATP-binding cassette domain-containing protein [Pseudomonadota bacterium]
MTAVLELQRYSIEVAGALLIDRLDVAVARGQVLGIFGDSGAGKSALLHLIAGLVRRPFRGTGRLLLNNEEIGSLGPSERSLKGISIVLQDLGLFSDLTVIENIAYPLRRRHWRTDEIRVRVEECLVRFGLDALGHRRPGELSGGQRQRVAFARALAYKPVLLLLDEPLRGLQDELRYELLAMLRRLCDEGTAIVLVSHDRDEVALIADQLVHLGTRHPVVEARRRDGFPSLRRPAPAPAPHRSLVDSDLLPSDHAEGVSLSILDIRSLPSGARCALTVPPNGQALFLQLAERSAITPGNYRIASTRLHELVYKEK